MEGTEQKTIKTKPNKKKKGGRQKKIYGVGCVKVKGEVVFKVHIWNSYLRLGEEQELEIQQEMDSFKKNEMEGAKTMTHT